MKGVYRQNTSRASLTDIARGRWAPRDGWYGDRKNSVVLWQDGQQMKGRPVRNGRAEGWPYGERKIMGVRRGRTEEGYLNKQSLNAVIFWPDLTEVVGKATHFIALSKYRLHLISLGDMGNGMTNKITIAPSSYGSTNQNQR
jgi:hypothetical protein